MSNEGSEITVAEEDEVVNRATGAVSPAQAAVEEAASKEIITIAKLKEIYGNGKLKKELGKVFPKGDTTIYKYINVSKLLKKDNLKGEFNEVFLARKPEITIDTDRKVYVYRDESGVVAMNRQNRSIVIKCTACVIKDDGKYKIVIASRLDTKHNMEEKEKENMKGGIGIGADAKKIFDYIEQSSNGTDIKSYTELGVGLLNPDFTTKMSAHLTSNHTTGNTDPVFIEYEVKADNIKTLPINKIINFTVKFYIIYDENEDIIYYSTKFVQNAIYTGDRFDGNYKKETPPPAAPKSAAPAQTPPAAPPVGVVVGVGEQKNELEKRVNKAEAEVKKLKENKNAKEEVNKAEKAVEEARTKINTISDKEREVAKINESITSLQKQQSGLLFENETGKGGIVDLKNDALNAQAEVKEAVNEAEAAVNEAEAAVKEAEAAAKEEQVLSEQQTGKTAEVDRLQIMSTPTSSLQTLKPATEEELIDDSVENLLETGLPTDPNKGGGKKRKLTRKQLNIMTLTELKQLHKVNKIKMNNNRTIKALINNYIKNYKKKIISKTKIGR